MADQEHYAGEDFNSQLESVEGLFDTGSQQQLQCTECGSTQFRQDTHGLVTCVDCGQQTQQLYSQESEYDEGQLARIGGRMLKVAVLGAGKRVIDPIDDALDESRLMMLLYTELIQQQAKALVTTHHCHPHVQPLLRNLWLCYIEWWHAQGWGIDDRHLLIGKVGAAYRRSDHLLPVQSATATYQTEDLPETVEFEETKEDGEYNDGNAEYTDAKSSNKVEPAAAHDEEESKSEYHAYNTEPAADEQEHQQHGILESINAPPALGEQSGTLSTAPVLRPLKRQRTDGGIYDMNKQNPETTTQRYYPPQAGELSMEISLALCYIACTIQQEPLTLHDIRRSAAGGSLPYLSLDAVPEELQLQLRDRATTRLFFSARHQPPSLKIMRQLVDAIAQRLNTLPNQHIPYPLTPNTAAIVQRLVMQLKLPTQVALLSNNLLDLLQGLNDTMSGSPAPAAKVKRNRFNRAQNARDDDTATWRMVPPVDDTMMAAAIVVCTKLLYSLDDVVRPHHPLLPEEYLVLAEQYEDDEVQRVYVTLLTDAMKLIHNLPDIDTLPLFANASAASEAGNHVMLDVLDQMSDWEFVNFCSKHVVPPTANAGDFDYYVDILEEAAANQDTARTTAEDNGSDNDLSESSSAMADAGPVRTHQLRSGRMRSIPRVHRKLPFEHFIQYSLTWKHTTHAHRMCSTLMKEAAKLIGGAVSDIENMVYGIVELLHKHVPSLELCLRTDLGSAAEELPTRMQKPDLRQSKRTGRSTVPRRRSARQQQQAEEKAARSRARRNSHTSSSESSASSDSDPESYWSAASDGDDDAGARTNKVKIAEAPRPIRRSARQQHGLKDDAILET